MYKFRVIYEVDGKIHRKTLFADTPTEIYCKIAGLHQNSKIEIKALECQIKKRI